MNLLAFVVAIGCVTFAVVAFAVPADVWAAVAERIRQPPRPSALEELHRHWEAMDLWPPDCDELDDESAS